MFDLKIQRRLLQKDMHGIFHFHLEACGSRVDDFRTIFWTKGATIFRNSQILKDVRIFVGGEMVTDASWCWGAPVLANLFMGHHEKRWLENCNSGIEFYLRYVDDTFALFNTEQDAKSFFKLYHKPAPHYQVYCGEERKPQAPLLRCSFR